MYSAFFNINTCRPPPAEKLFLKLHPELLVWKAKTVANDCLAAVFEAPEVRNMAIYNIDVTIESKPAALDPEGSTIANDLMRKNGYAMVKGVRTAKLLKISIDARSEEEAKKIAERMCNELRLVNPVAHVYSISVRK